MSTQADTKFTTAAKIAAISKKLETAIANWLQVLKTYRSQNTASTVETLQQHINAALLTLSTEYKAFQKDMDDPSKFSPYLVEGMTKLDAKLDSFGQVGNAANWVGAAAMMAAAPPAAWVVAEPLLSLRERTGAKHDKLTSYVAAIGEKVKAQKTNCYSGTISVKDSPSRASRENTCDVFEDMAADLKFADDLLGICGDDVAYETRSHEEFCMAPTVKECLPSLNNPCLEGKIQPSKLLPHRALDALDDDEHFVSRRRLPSTVPETSLRVRVRDRASS